MSHSSTNKLISVNVKQLVWIIFQVNFQSHPVITTLKALAQALQIVAEMQMYFKTK